MTYKTNPFRWALAAIACGLSCAALTGCGRSAAEAEAARSTQTNATAPMVPDDEVWRGLEPHAIKLGQTLLLVKGSRGIVACPYLNVETFSRGGEACAIVAAPQLVDIPGGKVLAVTPKAQELGIEVGMSGREALDKIR
jgi:uncharacterized protein YunC (DUF1805 family)